GDDPATGAVAGDRGHSMRVSRRQLVQVGGVAGLGLLVGCGRLPWQAQAPAKIYRIGWLGIPPSATSSPGGSPNLVAFQEGLRDLGYVEGQHFVIERRGGPVGQLPDLAAELVQLPVDVIVPGGGPATLEAARQATNAIPIVMVASAIDDPVSQGL